MQGRKLMLHAGRAVDGVGLGPHSRRRVGRALSFREHRPYQPGDDLRHVDWHVLARRDALMVKVFEDESPLRVELVMDASGSMGYGDKFFRAKVLAVALAQIALGHTEEVGLLAVRDPGARQSLRLVPARAGLGHLRAMAKAIDELPCSGSSPLASALTRLQPMLRRRSQIVVISDLWLDVPALQPALTALAHKGHDITLVHLWHRDEQWLPPVGQVLWRGMEHDGETYGDSEILRHSYNLAAEAHLQACARLGRTRGVAYVAAPSGVTDSALLGQVLTAHSRGTDAASWRF